MTIQSANGAEHEAYGGDDEEGSSKEEPQALIAQVREEERTNLQSRCDVVADVDLDHLIHAVQAIEATNKEIWERCEPHRFQPSNDGPGMTDLRFQRVLFTKIQVATGTEKQRDDDTSKLSFTTTSELEIKDFGRPSTIPGHLSEILEVPWSGDDDDPVFPIYEKFFRKSLLLNEEVLLPFLVSLKEHLESIQVFLGKIDSWLMEHAACFAFIEEHFEGKLDKTHADLHGCGSKCEMNHEPSQTCLCCGKPFSEHYSLRKHRCRSSVSQFGSFFVKSTHSLREFQVPWEHKQTFDISKKDDQERLVQFLAYATQYSRCVRQD